MVRSASAVAFARRGASTYLLTNAHVVEPSARWKGAVEVRVLADGARSRSPGMVVACGKAPDLDLAVIEVRGADLPVTPLAADDALELGDDLVVIGAPFGKGLSVAAGHRLAGRVRFLRERRRAARPEGAQDRRRDRLRQLGRRRLRRPRRPQLVGLVEGYRTARVAFGKDEGYAFDVPMPGETFVAPAAKIRRFLTARGLGQLAASAATAALGPAEVLAPATCRM